MEEYYERIKEINEEFSSYTIPEEPKEIIEYLMVGDKNSTDNFKILREFVLSQMHVDLYFDKIISEYNGTERASRVNLYTRNHKFPIINENGRVESKTQVLTGEYIFSQMLEGNMETYKEIVDFIKKYYETEKIFDENPINDVLTKEEIEDRRKQYLEWAKLEGKTEEDVDKEIKRIEEKNERLAEVKSLKDNKDTSLRDLKKEIEELLQKLKKKEELEAELSKLQASLDEDIEKSTSLSDNIRSTYQFIKSRKMGEQEREEILTRKPKNRLEKNIRDQYLKDKIATKKEELEGIEINEEEAQKSIEEKLQETKKYCISRLGKREIESLLSLGKTSQRFSEQLRNLSDGITTILEEEKLEQKIPGEYGFCYNNVFENVEHMAKDIKANLELGKTIYSPELVENQNFEELCHSIRIKMAEVGADTEVNPDNREMSVGIETEYRKDPYTIHQQNKNHFIKGGKYGHKEIAEKMQELGDRFTELQECSDVETYVRKSSDFVRDFVSLHPYSDGNGRTSRMLLNVMMAKRGLVIPSIIETYYDRKSSSDYSRAEQEATEGNYKPMQEYLLRRVRKFNPEIADIQKIDIRECTEMALHKNVTASEIAGADKEERRINSPDIYKVLEGETKDE